MRIDTDTFPLTPQPTRWAEFLICALAVSVGVLVYFYPSVLLVAIGTAMMAVALFRFDRFMAAMVIMLPWYPMVSFDIPIRDVFLVLRVFLFGITLFRVIGDGASVAKWLWGSRLKKAIVGFALLATLSILVSVVSINIGSVRALARLISYLAVFYSFEYWIRTPVRLVSVLKLLLVSLIVADLFGFYQEIVGGYSSIYFALYPAQEEALAPWEGRITSFLFQYNSLAGYLNLVFPIAIGCAVYSEDKTLKKLGRIATWLTVPSVFLTQSRGGVIALGVVILLGIWILNSSHKARIKMIVVALITCAVAIPLVLQYMDRLQQLDEATTLSRLALWQAGLIMFIGHPVLGVGYGNYRALYDNYLPGAVPGKLDSHSIYVQYLAELGVIGFSYFFAMMIGFITVFRRVLRDSNYLKRIAAFGALAAIVSLLVHGAVDYLFTVSPQFGGMFWLILAIGCSALRFDDSETQVPETLN
jgi:putative inorganic carbon (hco3(-)) transporter